MRPSFIVAGLLVAFSLNAEAAPARGRAARANPFERSVLLAGIQKGKERLRTFDTAGGASSPSDARSRFVVVRDRSGGMHDLAIPTPAKGPTPTSIFDVPEKDAALLGRMWRTILEQTGRPEREKSWSAWVHLPGSAAIDVLHVHGTPEDEDDRVRDWPSYVAKEGYVTASTTADYTLYVHPKRAPAGRAVVAVGSAKLGKPAALGVTNDEALGRMLLAVAAEARRRGITRGSISLDLDEDRVVVRTER